MTIGGKEYSNEELSRATEMLEKLDKSGYEYTTLGREKYLIDNFIPKDKIKELIVTLGQHKNDKIDVTITYKDAIDTAITALGELLEEG